MDLPPPAQEEVAPVERSLTAEIAERCDLARAEVVDVGVTLPEGAEILSWLGDPCVPLPRLRVNFRLNGTQTSAPANPTLELWVDGPVAPADVPAGQPFVIATGPIPWRAAQGNHLTGTVVSRVDLGEGDAVTPRDARRVPDAERGAQVEIVVKRGLVRLAAPAELLSAAFVGDRVMVRNHTTQTIQRGVLVDRDTVELTP